MAKRCARDNVISEDIDMEGPDADALAADCDSEHVPSIMSTANPSPADELVRVRREIRVLREERDILRKVAAFFAQEAR
jgi:transposase